MAPPATSELSLRSLGVFREDLRQTGKLRLPAAALEPPQGHGALVLEEKTKVQRGFKY